MSDMHCCVFGLCLAVPFPVGKELQAPAGMPVDVYVRLERSPYTLPRTVHRSIFVDTGIEAEVDDRGDMLLRTTTARYYIVGGHTVSIDAESTLTQRMMRSMVLYHCLPILINQRGDFALHANAIHTSRGAIILAGSSGSGKSTLHAALLGRGMTMLSDDVAVLRRITNGYEVLPGTRRYSMTGDTWERMRPPAEQQVIQLGGPRKKVALRVPESSFHNKPASLNAVYLIEPHVDTEVIVQRLEGIAVFRTLQTQAYLPLGSIALPQHLSSFSKLLEQIVVYRIRRPVHRWTADELADIVLSSDPLLDGYVHG